MHGPRQNLMNLFIYLSVCNEFYAYTASGDHGAPDGHGLPCLLGSSPGLETYKLQSLTRFESYR